MALKRSLAWMGLGQVSALVLQFGSSVVLARWLTLHDMGVYAVAAATAGLVSVVQEFGLRSLIVREEVLTPAISTTAFTLNIMFSLGLSLVIAAMALLGGHIFGDNDVRRVLLALALNPLFGIVEFLPSANLERHGRFREMAMISTASGLAGAALTIVLAVLGFSYMTMAYASWLSAAVNAGLMCIVGRQHLQVAVGLQAWRRVANFGLQMLAVSGINTISARLSEIILARILGVSALGIYNRASSLNKLLWNNVHIVIGRVVFVDFADLNRRGVPLRASYMRTVEVVTAVLWPGFAGLAILSGPFIAHVYGPKWLPAALPFALLAVSSMIQVSITMTWELFAATGSLKAQTQIEFMRTVPALLTFLAACNFSLAAAAATRALDSLVAFFLYRPHLDRMTQTSLHDFLPIYARSALVSCLGVLPAAVLMLVYRLSADVPLVLVALAIGGGVALWGFGLALVENPIVGEARVVVRRLRNRRLAA